MHIPRSVAKGDMEKTCTQNQHKHKHFRDSIEREKVGEGDREDGELEEPLIRRKKLPWEW